MNNMVKAFVNYHIWHKNYLEIEKKTLNRKKIASKDNCFEK